MFGLGFGELILIFLIALIFIGPKKLPELAKGLGVGIREFQKAAKGLTDQLQDAGNEAKKPDLHMETPTVADRAAHPPIEVVSAEHVKTENFGIAPVLENTVHPKDESVPSEPIKKDEAGS
ncbi:MAG TPA: twin-arginine translocase TatA/TatE family subunit [Bacteriovoracaceae bacterium]|nr:twin-arginine translocase TatA/TatE family subunit [Bacteriovoracaceae bacterium]